MTTHFSWTRAAYVFFVLAVLAALLRIGGSSTADSRALASDPPVEVTVSDAAVAEDIPLDGITQTVPPAEESRSRVELAPPVRSTAEEPRPGSATDDEPPVFYRPAAVPAKARKERGGTPDAGSGTVCGDLRKLPRGNKAVFPLADTYFDSYSDTWGAPRPQGGHEGADLMTYASVPEYAITDGTVVPVSGANGNGWNTLGGYTVMVRADYDVGPIKAGDLFYYAHMKKPSELEIGDRVRAGQVVGYAGDTGQGPEGTTGLFPTHLHLGWYDTSGARTNLDSGAMNPYPLLEWIKSNGGAVAGGSDVEYCEAPQSGPPVPSSGGDTWTYPDSPGVRPDMDTGSDDARPSPVVKQRRDSAEQTPDRQDRRNEQERGGPQDENEQERGTKDDEQGQDRQDEDAEATRPERTQPGPDGPPDEGSTGNGPSGDKQRPGDRDGISARDIRERVSDLIDRAFGPGKDRPNDRQSDGKDGKDRKRDKPKKDKGKSPGRDPAREDSRDRACDPRDANEPCGEETTEPVEETTGPVEETPPPENETEVRESTVPETPVSGEPAEGIETTSETEAG